MPPDRLSISVKPSLRANAFATGSKRGSASDRDGDDGLGAMLFVLGIARVYACLGQPR